MLVYRSSCANICFIWFVTPLILSIVRQSYSPRGLAIVSLSHFTFDYSLPFVPTSPVRVSTIYANPTLSFLVLFLHRHCAKVLHQPYILFGFQDFFHFLSLNCSVTPVCLDLSNIESFCSFCHLIQPP